VGFYFDSGVDKVVCVCVWCVSKSVDACKFSSVFLCLSVWIFLFGQQYWHGSVCVFVCVYEYACVLVWFCVSLSVCLRFLTMNRLLKIILSLLQKSPIKESVSCKRDL